LFCQLTARSTFVNMDGYLEKLPLNKKKATLLKTWKRRYFKALNGMLYYFEVRTSAHLNSEHTSSFGVVGTPGCLEKEGYQFI